MKKDRSRKSALTTVGFLEGLILLFSKYSSGIKGTLLVM